MLKMSYREKIVALVLIVLVIVLIFVMWPIKTLREKIKTDTANRDTIKVTYDDYNRQINEIPVIEENIKKIYSESKDLNKDFSVHRENFQIDEYVQNILNKDEYKDGDKNKMEIKSGFAQVDADAGDFDFYYYEPTVIEYPILENADTNGTLLNDTNPELFKKVENAVLMETLEGQEVEIHDCTFSAKFTKEALYKFIDDLEKDDKGVRVVGLNIGDYRFGNLNPEKIAAMESTAFQDMIGYSEGSIVLEFYTMEAIQEPRLD